MYVDGTVKTNGSALPIVTPIARGADGRWAHGNRASRGNGRPRGKPNKVTRELKEMVMQALVELGGVAWLVQVAKEHPSAFMALLTKLLPLGDNEVSFRVVVERPPQPVDALRPARQSVIAQALREGQHDL